MWHTPWDDAAPGFPHRLDLELPQAAAIAGLTLLPRQDGNRNGWIRSCEVFASDDGKAWIRSVAKGSFSRDDGLKTVKFASPVTTRFLRLVAIDSFDRSKPYASLAEIEFLAAGP